MCLSNSPNSTAKKRRHHQKLKNSTMEIFDTKLCKQDHRSLHSLTRRSNSSESCQPKIPKILNCFWHWKLKSFHNLPIAWPHLAKKSWTFFDSGISVEIETGRFVKLWKGTVDSVKNVTPLHLISGFSILWSHYVYDSMQHLSCCALYNFSFSHFVSYYLALTGF